MRAYIFAVIFILYLRIVGWTSRVRYIGEESIPARPFVYIFWHRHIFFVSYSHRARAIRVLLSTSKDGDIAALTNKWLGHRVIRGTASSPREGARSIVQMMGCLRRGHVVAMVPDGPRGPRLKAKKGAAYISDKLDCPLVPIAWAAKRKTELRSWDRTVIPFPFNDIVVVEGKPLYLKGFRNMEEAQREITDRLNEVNSLAESRLEEK